MVLRDIRFFSQTPASFSFRMRITCSNRHPESNAMESKDLIVLREFRLQIPQSVSYLNLVQNDDNKEQASFKLTSSLPFVQISCPN